jgi:hypothetical protein
VRTAPFLVFPGLIVALVLAALPEVLQGRTPSASTAGGLTVVLLLMFLVGLPLMLWLYVRWVLASAAFAVDRLDTLAAIRRSSQLVQGTWWRTFGILLLVGLVVGLVPGIVSTALGGGFAGSPVSPASFLATTVVSQLVALPFVPISPLLLTLLFLDLRQNPPLD